MYNTLCESQTGTQCLQISKIRVTINDSRMANLTHKVGCGNNLDAFNLSYCNVCFPKNNNIWIWIKFLDSEYTYKYISMQINVLLFTQNCNRGYLKLFSKLRFASCLKQNEFDWIPQCKKCPILNCELYSSTGNKTVYIVFNMQVDHLFFCCICQSIYIFYIVLLILLFQWS